MKTKIKYLLVLIVLFFSIALTSTIKAQANSNQFIVVIDAGHGGGDSGNVGNGYKEKDIALKIALDVGEALAGNPNIKVIYTRKTDVFVELFERANIANKADADLYVSIHCNSVTNPKPYGTETWVLGAKNTARNFEVAKRENEVIFLEDNYEKNYAGFDPSSPESTIAIGLEQEVYIEQSIILARKIEDKFVNKAKRKSRGLKQGSLLVIRNTYMPSVLVEVGFLTNTEEGKFLNTKNGQSKMAVAIKEAILEYKEELDGNVGENIFAGSSNAATLKPVDEEETIIPSEKRIIKDVTFKIQIAASSKKLDLKPYNFKGLSPISRESEGGLFKYFYGETSDYNQALALKEQAKAKGFNSCFLVAYKNEKRITVGDALKTDTN
jgi:N-acetylmuramoyl-L-alanine amidase